MQTELIEQIIHLPIAERVELIERISRSLREDLHRDRSENFQPDEHKAAYLRLRGSLKMKNPPVTKEQERETYHEYLSEKHK